MRVLRTGIRPESFLMDTARLFLSAVASAATRPRELQRKAKRAKKPNRKGFGGAFSKLVMAGHTQPLARVINAQLRYYTKAALLIALLTRWDDARDDGRERTCRAAVISARRRRVSSSRYRAASAFDRSSAISEISYLDFR